MKKSVKILIGVVSLLLVLLVVAKKMGWIGSDSGLPVELGKVERRDIVETVLASGKIQPEVEVKISAEVSGEIVELPVTEGQKVKAGELLVRINPDLFEAAVSRARAAVNSAKAALASAQAQLIEADNNFKRNKQLYDKKVISASEFDAVQRAYEVARLGVESARFQRQSASASLEEALNNLQRTTIYAPQDGTISLLNSELGERVVGTAQMTGTEILRVANLARMEVLVEVNENDIIRISRGDTAIVEVEAYLGESFKGVVTQIANSATGSGTSNLGNDQVTSFEVKVRIIESSYQHLLKEGQETPFRPGMTASLEIQTRRKAQVLAVPIQAVSTRKDTGLAKGAEAEEWEVVFGYSQNRVQLRRVETGIQDDSYIEILSGLEEEEEIVVGPYGTVTKSLQHGKLVSPEK